MAILPIPFPSHGVIARLPSAGQSSGGLPRQPPALPTDTPHCPAIAGRGAFSPPAPPVPALQAEWTRLYGEITITGYYNYNRGTFSDDVSIPATLDGLPGNRIGERAFRDNRRLTGITIPASVTFMGAGVFLGIYWDDNQDDFYSGLRRITVDEANLVIRRESRRCRLHERGGNHRFNWSLAPSRSARYCC